MEEEAKYQILYKTLRDLDSGYLLNLIFCFLQTPTKPYMTWPLATFWTLFSALLLFIHWNPAFSLCLNMQTHCYHARTFALLYSLCLDIYLGHLFTLFRLLLKFHFQKGLPWPLFQNTPILVVLSLWIAFLYNSYHHLVIYYITVLYNWMSKEARKGEISNEGESWECQKPKERQEVKGLRQYFRRKHWGGRRSWASLFVTFL